MFSLICFHNLGRGGLTIENKWRTWEGGEHLVENWLRVWKVLGTAWRVGGSIRGNENPVGSKWRAWGCGGPYWRESGEPGIVLSIESGDTGELVVPSGKWLESLGGSGTHWTVVEREWRYSESQQIPLHVHMRNIPLTNS
jgi:hypothetical protein